MRRWLIFLCILSILLIPFAGQIDGQEKGELSKIGLRNRTAGFQAIWNYLQSQGQTSYVKGWWRFDEASGNLIDLSGNSNTLTANGTPSYQQADYLNLGRAITFDGATDYFSIADGDQTGLDLNGAEILTDGGLESWTDDTPDYWTKVGAVTKEIVEVHGDSAAAKFTINAANDEASIKQNETVETSTQYTLEVWRKHSVEGKTAKLVVRNITTGNYLQSDGTWGATAGFEIANVTAWGKYVFPGQFITEALGTTLEIKVMNGTAASSSIYVDDISLTKCFDAVILVIAKTSDDGNDITLLAKDDGTAYRWQKVGSNKQTLSFSDGTYSYVVGGSTINDGKWKLLQLSLNRSGNGRAYLQGSTDGSATDISARGNVANARPFAIGATSWETSFWDGSIAEVMILTGAPLDGAILSDAFALFAYNQALGYPTKLPRRIN